LVETMLASVLQSMQSMIDRYQDTNIVVQKLLTVAARHHISRKTLLAWGAMINQDWQVRNACQRYRSYDDSAAGGQSVLLQTIQQLHNDNLELKATVMKIENRLEKSEEMFTKLLHAIQTISYATVDISPSYRRKVVSLLHYHSTFL
jgi:hypothetical protein